MAHIRATEVSHVRLEEAAKHRREQLILREELQLECNRRVERCGGVLYDRSKPDDLT